MAGKNNPARQPASFGAEVAGSAPEPAFDEVWERIKGVIDVKNQSQLADILEIKTPSITGAKQRGTFPLAWAYKLAWTYNVSLDFLLFGVEREKSPQACGGGTLASIDPTIPIFDEALEITGASVSKKQQTAILEIVREELKTITIQIIRVLKRGACGDVDK